MSDGIEQENENVYSSSSKNDGNESSLLGSNIDNSGDETNTGLLDDSGLNQQSGLENNEDDVENNDDQPLSEPNTLTIIEIQPVNNPPPPQPVNKSPPPQPVNKSPPPQPVNKSPSPQPVPQPPPQPVPQPVHNQPAEQAKVVLVEDPEIKELDNNFFSFGRIKTFFKKNYGYVSSGLKSISNIIDSTSLKCMKLITDTSVKAGESVESIFKKLYSFLMNNKVYISSMTAISIISAFLYYYLGENINQNTINNIDPDYLYTSFNNLLQYVNPFKNVPIDEFPDNPEIQKSILYCELLNYQQERVFGNSYEKGYKLSSSLIFNRVAKVIMDYKKGILNYNDNFVLLAGLSTVSLNMNFNKHYSEFYSFASSNFLSVENKTIKLKDLILVNNYVPVGKMVKELDEYYSGGSVNISVRNLNVISVVNKNEKLNYLVDNPVKYYGLLCTGIKAALTHNIVVDNERMLENFIK